MQDVSNSERESPQEFCQRLRLPFSDWLLVSRALTHRSYLNEHPEALEDNERLEFLGDAVLDFVVGAWLYNHYPEMPEGDLTRMRSALVHTHQLAEFARQMKIGQALRLGKGESQAGGYDRDAILCDTFEAVIGALYLDAGLDAVIQYISPMLQAASNFVLQNHTIEDPKSRFQEWAQSRGFQAPVYLTRNAVGPDHSRIFEVDAFVNGVLYGTGKGPSKQSAAKEAARQALKHIGVDS